MTLAAPPLLAGADTLHRELWTSFVSVLRSYLAAHTLNGREQAVLEVSAESLLVRIGTRSLYVEYPIERIDKACHPERSGSVSSTHAVEEPALSLPKGPAFCSARTGAWQRENQPPVPFHFDEHGRIVVDGQAPEGAQEMDIVAEHLAREITTP